MRFSIVIPAYNEERVLREVLDNIKKIIVLKNYEAEIIVVDDGSGDKTAEIARSAGAIVLQHGEKRGYGSALKTGIEASKNEIIVILDADGSYPVSEMPVLLNEIDRYEMVVGARTGRNAKISFLKKMPKYVLTKLAEYLVMQRIPDVNSGFRAFKKSMYKKYVHLLPAGFSFTLTITLCSASNHERIKFAPISYYKRKGASKIRPIYDTLNFFLLIIKTILFFNPARVFLPIAVFFIFIALVVALYSTFITGKFLDVTVTLLFIFGIQLIVLGLIADLINRRAK